LSLVCIILFALVFVLKHLLTAQQNEIVKPNT